MKVLKGCETNPDQFLALLAGSSKVSIIIDFYNNLVEIRLHDNCGGATLVFYNEDLKGAACVATLNALMRTSYAGKEVCLTVIPSPDRDSSATSSMAQGLAEIAQKMVCDFATNEMYPRMQAVINKSLQTYEP